MAAAMASSYERPPIYIYNRAAGAGPVGQAMAGPLLTIIVKYCDSSSFLVDSLPRGARDQQTECAHGRGFASARGAAAPDITGATINGMASPGFPVYAVRYNTRARRLRRVCPHTITFCACACNNGRA